MFGLFSYFTCKIWCHILALWPRFSTKVTKFRAYLVVFEIWRGTDRRQTDWQKTDAATDTEGSHTKCASLMTAFNLRTWQRIWLTGNSHVLLMGAVMYTPSSVVAIFQRRLISTTFQVVQPDRSTAGTDHAPSYHRAIFSVYTADQWPNPNQHLRSYVEQSSICQWPKRSQKANFDSTSRKSLTEFGEIKI